MNESKNSIFVVGKNSNINVKNDRIKMLELDNVNIKKQLIEIINYVNSSHD